MTAAVSDAPAFVVIYPDGRWEFRALSDYDAVESLCADNTTLGTATVPTYRDDSLDDEQRLRAWHSDVMLLGDPPRFPVNNAARHAIKHFSGGRVIHTWRGVVALVEYDRDPRTGEIGFPKTMSEQRREEIRRFLENL